MRSALLWLAVLLLVAPHPADCAMPQTEYDGKHSDADDYDEDDYDDDDGGIMQRWHDVVGRVRQAVDGEGLMRARRWGNVANGLLLGITGPVTLAVSLIKMRLSDIVLSLYVTGFGAALTGIELGLDPISSWTEANMNFLTTPKGRTMMLVFVGNLIWTFGNAGLVPALLTCVNSIFNANFQQLLEFVNYDCDSNEAARGACKASRVTWSEGGQSGNEKAETKVHHRAESTGAFAQEAFTEGLGVRRVTETGTAAAETEMQASVEAALEGLAKEKASDVQGDVGTHSEDDAAAMAAIMEDATAEGGGKNLYEAAE